MNTYLFCTLLFVLSMKSSHALNLYRNFRLSTEKFSNYVPSDEFDVVLGNTNEEAKKELEDLEKANIEPLTNQNFTYMVAFVSKVNSEILCQGALIDPNWVLTSAVCLKKYALSLGSIAIISGFHLNSIVASEMKKIYFHPDFQLLSNINDIALVELESPINNDAITPIAMTNSRDPSTARCDFSAIFNYSMIAFRVDLVSPIECMRKELPKQSLYYYCAGVNGRQIVLTEDDMLGVPLVCNGVLFGIKSFSTEFTGVPDVYDWIMSQLKEQPTKIDDSVPSYTSVMKSSEHVSHPGSQQSEPEKH